jgi:hypothetical protein
VNPDETEIAKFCADRHLQCITLKATTVTGNTAGALVIDSASVISQLTNVISIQNEKAMESNNLRCKEIERQVEREEKKKDKTKDLHPAIMNMLLRAAATHSNNKREEIDSTCQCFINAKNIGLAQYKLIHQFKIGGFLDVTFTLGITQALFLGEFLYANFSTPSNFTNFAFHKQEPNSSNQQTDFLICHLIQEQGQKKTHNKIKALLKHAIHVPLDIVGLGTQLQLFAAALSIFFGKENVCTDKLKYLLLLLGCNKKRFCDQIALNKFFATKFLFAIDRRVQRWLRMCEQASVSCTQVNDNILNFDNLLDQVLNRSFQMNLPTSFKKIKNSPCNAPSVESK